jgi:hypothetical protein
MLERGSASMSGSDFAIAKDLYRIGADNIGESENREIEACPPPIKIGEAARL